MAIEAQDEMGLELRYLTVNNSYSPLGLTFF